MIEVPAETLNMQHSMSKAGTKRNALVVQCWAMNPGSRPPAHRPTGKKKEAGHYSGLNENRHSKSLLNAAATESLHTVNCPLASNNESRISQPAVLACHQMWVQQGPSPDAS